MRFHYEDVTYWTRTKYALATGVQEILSIKSFLNALRLLKTHTLPVK